MKRIIILLVTILFTITYLQGQNYNNIVNHHFNGTPVNGVKIKTNLPFTNGSFMPTIKIEGYNYYEQSVGASILDLNIALYVLQDKFYNPTMSTSGGSAPDVWLSVEDGKIVIFLDQRIYYQRFTISAYAKGMSKEGAEYFTGWTVVDEPLSGSDQTLVPYKNVFRDLTIDKFTTNNFTANSLQLNGTNSIRIGKIGDSGNRNVPIGDVTTQYNIDFSGYRDMYPDQIGARIASIRFNNYQENKAYIQKTGLTFYTNNSGYKAGEEDLVERMRITPEGNIGIGIINPQNKLEVAGTIRAKEVKIESTGWADFVFGHDYELPSLKDVEKHIIEKQTLPGIPSEEEVKENGIDLGKMQIKLLQKIEELTLYTIQQQKQLEEQAGLLKQLQEQLNKKQKK